MVIYLNKYFNYIKKIENKIINHYQFLHMNPEIGFNLPITYNYVFNYLESLGLKPTKCGKSGIICDIGNNKENIILLRADMDALEIYEKNEIFFKSKNCYMHACGHDAHTAILLGVAEILKDLTFDGTIRLMFQPAEEILSGAIDMIDNDCLRNVKYAIMLHMLPSNDFENGTIILPISGIISPISNHFEFRLKGKSVHAAYVDKSKDLLFIFNKINDIINNFVISENLNETNILYNISSIEYGSSYNVIPDTLKVLGNFRTFNKEVGKFLIYKIEEITSVFSKLYDITIKFIINHHTCEFNNNNELKENIIEILKRNNIKHHSFTQYTKNWGSEDFANVSKYVKTNMILLSYNNDPNHLTLHNPFFLINDSSLVYGVNALVNISLGLIEKNNLK